MTTSESVEPRSKNAGNNHNGERRMGPLPWKVWKLLWKVWQLPYFFFRYFSPGVGEGVGGVGGGVGEGVGDGVGDENGGAGTHNGEGMRRAGREQGEHITTICE